MRRRRTPHVQLARAGERLRLLIGDSPVRTVRFRATVLDGAPAGRIDIETVGGARTEPLAEDNRLEVDGLISLSVVPERDTAVSFVPIETRRFNPAAALGGLMILVAIGWTLWNAAGG